MSRARQSALLWLVLFACLPLLFWLYPVHLAADVFSVLPAQSKTVQGLKQHRQSFANSHAIEIAVTGDTSEQTQQAVDLLAQLLPEAGLSQSTIASSPLEPGTESFAELVAWQWLNQDNGQWQNLLTRLQPTQLDAYLEQQVVRMATSFNAREVGLISQDPLGLLKPFADQEQSGEGPVFASSDGRLRLLYISYPGEEPDFWQYRAWLTELQTYLEQLYAAGDLPEGIQLGMTGNPVYVEEFGSRMLKDLSQAAISTLLVVLLIFWWMYRRLSALLWLSATLLATLAISIWLGSLVLGQLSVISLGFAAILMGLAVDYGLLLYQEFRYKPGQSAGELRRSLTPSIGWAALTTAFAFLMVARSSLPGLTQLGVMVAIGIVTAAVLVLTLYLASVHRSDRQHPPLPAILQLDFRKRLPVGRASIAAMVLAGVFMLLMPPKIVTDVDALQFSDLQAQRVRAQIDDSLGKGGHNERDLWLMLSSPRDEEMGMRLQQARSQITPWAEQLDLILELPEQLWPSHNRQVESLTQDLPDWSPIQASLAQAGFAPEAGELAHKVLRHWQMWQQELGDDILWPSTTENRWLLNQLISHEEADQVLVLGVVRLPSGLDITTESDWIRQFNQQAGQSLIGWPLLAKEVADTMLGDAIKVVVPLLSVLILMLALAFRNLTQVMLSLATLGFALVLLNALMSLLGWSWNIMNLTALPLLLGAGVDYSIHTQLALQRHGGDRNRVYQTVGIAILLCGTSTAVGFASLGLASNPGLASLGQVAGLGIILTALTAVLLLPAWWQRLCQPEPKAEPKGNTVL